MLQNKEPGLAALPRLVAFGSGNYFPALDLLSLDLPTLDLPTLDGLRAVSILPVFFVPIDTPDMPMIRVWIGVSLFFVPSAFLITTAPILVA